MKDTKLTAAAAGVLLAGCSASKESVMTEGKQQAQTFSAKVTAHVRYLLYLPDGYASSDRQWPVVLFLHGAGERGNDLALVKRHGPPRLVDEGKNFPFILVSPQCPEDESWSVPALSALLDDIERSCNVDRSREYLTGLSMGGNGTWRLAMASPDRFAAIAPICGWGDTSAVRVLKNTPTWAFHGKQDKLILVEKSESLIRSLKASGGNAQLTVYPEAGHDSWTETYNNPAFYDWMLAQKRSR